MMNQELQGYARDWLNTRLQLCTEGQQEIFKLMYSHKNPEKSIPDIIADMPEDNLDWAMQQIRRTLEENNA